MRFQIAMIAACLALSSSHPTGTHSQQRIFSRNQVFASSLHHSSLQSLGHDKGGFANQAFPEMSHKPRSASIFRKRMEPLAEGASDIINKLSSQAEEVRQHGKAFENSH